MSNQVTTTHTGPLAPLKKVLASPAINDLLHEKLTDAMQQERHDNPVCPWCNGRGYEYADGGRLQWKCPDCEGTGGRVDNNENNGGTENEMV